MHSSTHIMTAATIDGLIARSLCIGIVLPRETHHQEMRYLTPAQVVEIAHLMEPRYQH